MFNTTLARLAAFHGTSPVFQSITRYIVNGVQMTIQEVTSVRPSDRTVEHWKVLTDWDLQRSRQYVVVDPLDPSSLLYLSYADYLSVMKVALSNQQPLLVVANPKTSAPVPIHSDPSAPSQNSPYMVELEKRWSKSARLSWKQFLNLQTQVKNLVTLAKGTKMVSVSPSTVARTMYLWWRELLHYVEVKHPVSYLRYLIPTVTRLKVLLSHNGQAATILYLKVSLFAVYSYVFGNPLSTTIHLGIGVRLSKGLPTFLDVHLRDGIRQNHPSIIRLVTSLLNIYRALYAKHGAPVLSTITQAHPDLSEASCWERFKTFCQEDFPAIVESRSERGRLPYFKYDSAAGLMVRSAGANLSSPAVGSIILDATAWCSLPGQKNHVVDWFNFHGDHIMGNLVHTLAGESHWGDFSQLLIATRTPVKNVDRFGNPAVILGRLHAIDEPAGKVRIVAIADYFTQVAMKPVHEHLFKILKILSFNDGTFDQDGVTHGYFNRGLKPHWSFDLKAATDLIPLALYKEVLIPFLQSEGESMEHARGRVDLWAKVLTDREWLTPDGNDFVRYGTGQPMGALSSWASMALVHHALVQFSAREAGHIGWYGDYLVLGDDVDIAVNAAVADSYKNVCSQFKITIGLAKSLESDSNSFEFANRRFAPFGEISPLSLKEELAASTWAARGEFAKRILSRFGTSLKDQGTALLRKATTATQWYRIIPELSGLRVSVFSRIARYCLLNPFSVLEPKDIRVSHIMEWIALLFPSGAAKPFLRENDTTRRLTLQIVDRLVESVSVEARSLLDRVPQPGVFSINDTDGASKSAPFTLQRKVRGPSKIPADLLAARLKALQGSDWRQPTVNAIVERPWLNPSGSKPFSLTTMQFPGPGGKPMVINVPPRDFNHKKLLLTGMHRTLLSAPVALSYLLFCFNKHNETIKRDIESLMARDKILRGFLDPSIPAQSSLDGIIYQKEDLIGPYLELWMELRSIPKPIVPLFQDGISTILDYQGASQAPAVRQGRVVADENLRQRIFGPLKELSEIVARVTGLFIPGFPFFNDNRRGKHWAKTIKGALKWYTTYTTKFSEIEVGYQMYDRLFPGGPGSVKSVPTGSVGSVPLDVVVTQVTDAVMVPEEPSGPATVLGPDGSRSPSTVLLERLSRIEGLEAHHLEAVGLTGSPQGDPFEDEPLDVNPEPQPQESDQSGKEGSGRRPDIPIVIGPNGQPYPEEWVLKQIAFREEFEARRMSMIKDSMTTGQSPKGPRIDKPFHLLTEEELAEFDSDDED